MIRRLLRSLAPALLLALIAGQAWAEVTVTFYAHPGARVRDGYLLVPHAYVHAEGTKIALLMLNTFFAILVGGLCLFAVLKIAFAG